MSYFFKKYFIYFMVAVLFLVVGKILSSQSEGDAAEETLTVGLQSGYPPFEFMDEKGKIVGFDLDVAHYLADKLGKKLVVKDMEFEGEILSLKQGKIDLIVSGMNIIPSRLKEILMVPYHGEEVTSLSLIFWKEIPQGMTKLEDIANYPHAFVSVELGAIPEDYIKKYPQINTKSFPGALAPLMDVKYGKSLANLVETDVAEYLQQKHPEIKILNVPLPKEEKILGFGIGVSKKNQELFNQVQQIIQELKASGELKALEDKWFKGEH